MNGEVANAAIKELKAIRKGDIRDEKTLEVWEKEAKALTEVAELRHDHIIQVRAIISKGKRQYFMFQWADGGSLRDFFETHERILDEDFVKEVIGQLAGLAAALDQLHNWGEGDGSWRHGDLKPENILRFEDGTRTGTWKIADMGLARHHFAPTGRRSGPTSTQNGTPLYGPPEAVTSSATARSRLYDIWSLGCITLEILVWLMDGFEALVKFNNSLKNLTGSPAPYWASSPSGSPTVHPKVSDRMAILEERLKTSGPMALAHLLNIIKNDLLVVALPDNRTTVQIGRNNSDTVGSPSNSTDALGTSELPTIRISQADQAPVQAQFGRRRTTAGRLCGALQGIQEAGEVDPKYWRSSASDVHDLTSTVAPSEAKTADPTELGPDSGGGLMPSPQRDNVGLVAIIPPRQKKVLILNIHSLQYVLQNNLSVVDEAALNRLEHSLILYHLADCKYDLPFSNGQMQKLTASSM